MGAGKSPPRKGAISHAPSQAWWGTGEATSREVGVTASRAGWNTKYHMGSPHGPAGSGGLEGGRWVPQGPLGQDRHCPGRPCQHRGSMGPLSSPPSSLEDVLGMQGQQG